MMELAPRRVQDMPDYLRREARTILQPASITPETTASAGVAPF